ncbi:hypothetical protein Hamer_G011329, partial [Homarus americanus]
SLQFTYHLLPLLFTDQGRRTSPIDVSGHKRHKANSDLKPPPSDVRRPTSALNRTPNGPRFEESSKDGASKSAMRRDSQSWGPSWPHRRRSRSASPDQGGRRSPSSGRSTPSNSRSPTALDERAKSIINKTSETDKVMEQFVGQESDEGSKSKSGGGGSGDSTTPTPHPRSSKPPVEDRALQAILAARRRSLENAGKSEPRRSDGEEEKKEKESEEAKGFDPPASEPKPWMAGVVVRWEDVGRV